MAKKEIKDSVIFYQRQIDICKKHLTAEQFGRLMYALFELDQGNEPEVDDDIAIAFDFMALQNRLDREKYEKRCERNRENGKKGGAPKGNQNARKNNPKQPNGFQNNPNDNDNDNENDNVNVNVNDNESGSDDTTFYGTLGNVELTPGEFDHIRKTYERPGELIDKVSLWLPNSKGAHVGDHYALCLKFANNDNWPKRKIIEPAEPIVVTDPIDPEKQEVLVRDMKKRLGGLF